MPMTKRGRAKLSKLMKERHRNGTIRRAKARKHKKEEEVLNGDAPFEVTPQILGYALGRIEGWLEAVAESHSVSRVALAEQVADTLLSKVRREKLGPVHQVSEMRYSTAKELKRLS